MAAAAQDQYSPESLAANVPKKCFVQKRRSLLIGSSTQESHHQALSQWTIGFPDGSCREVVGTERGTIIEVQLSDMQKNTNLKPEGTALSKKDVEELLKKGAYGSIMDEENESAKFNEEDIETNSTAKNA